MKFIYNAALVDFDDAIISADGWLKGSGIFETIKTVDGVAWALSRHMRRALSSAVKMGISLPSEEVVRSCIESLLTHEAHDRGALRISFDNKGNWAAFHSQYIEKAQAARVSVVQDYVIVDSTPIKSFPYTHRLEILKNAVSNGFDEAILVNAHDMVCEGAVTNLLFSINGQWITPPLTDGVLPGVMRALVIEYLSVKVRSIHRDELAEVDSAFLLSSLRIAQPISAIQGRQLSVSLGFGEEIRAMALRTSIG